jgi:SAM-dependent methyltransferase
MNLWDLLRCPACGSRLTTERLSGEDSLLRSECGLWFPVIRDIPRIFVGEMRSVYRADFPEFLERHGLDERVESVSRDAQQKVATRESFGFEWTRFHEMLPEWEKNASFYFEPLGGLEALRGLTMLEAGCGKGRHTYYALRAGARVVAVDFSQAIDVAANNCRSLPGDRLFVQADIMALPFARASFDVAYSFGVLHHLPDPESGFQRLVELVRPGGHALIYLYHALEGQPVKQALLRMVNAVRAVSTRTPHRVLLPLTTALGWALYVGVVAPYRVLSRFDSTRPIAEHFPLKTYADYPVRVIVNDQFDRFSAPIENRYRRDEVDQWLAHAGLADHVILSGSGWRAAGRKTTET